jgi:signal transduction histidine kinase
MDCLIAVVQELSLARSLDRIVQIVRSAARALTGADGATFVLRESSASGDVCHYVDEDAVGPLWKGRRFPASACISGWAMQHRSPAVVEDVMSDPRIPVEAYVPTFVKSLVMMPIRSAAPIGAIGCYWAARRIPSASEVRLLQALADSTSIAMENVEVYSELERRVAARTSELSAARAELAAKNDELEALARRKEELSALVVHDIKGPAAALMVRARLCLRQATTDDERRAWTSIYTNGDALARLATDLLDIARSEDGSLRVAREAVDVDRLVAEVHQLMQPLAEARGQAMLVGPACSGSVTADPDLLRRVLQNLSENALLHNARHGTVRLDARVDGDEVLLAVSDEGPGVPIEQRERIFERYARLGGANAPRTGRGLGLTFCRLAVEAHGGTIWVEDALPHGTRFCVRMARQHAMLPELPTVPNS